MTIRSSIRASAALLAAMLAFAVLHSSPRPALAEFRQQAKIHPFLDVVGSPGPHRAGRSVALSADGNTVLVGAPTDSGSGAAWVLVRRGGVWSWQEKLIGVETTAEGTRAVLYSWQGFAVALSADGNTAVVGGPGNGCTERIFDPGEYYVLTYCPGAAWFFRRSGGDWVAEGGKRFCHGVTTAPRQGYSVAISADGNTAIVGAPMHYAGHGQACVWRRNASGYWSIEARLAGTGNVRSARQGFSVGLSADGNTAILGGPADNGTIGAAWIFTRTDAWVFEPVFAADGSPTGRGRVVRRIAWTQQAKLVGTGAVGAPQQGYSVALSADGNTAILGGRYDARWAGAAWVFTRSGRVWAQQAKLVGTGAVPEYGLGAWQGHAVALSADGNTAILGGPLDDSDRGAAWVFKRRGAVWSQDGGKLVGTGFARLGNQGAAVALSGDGNTAAVGGPTDAEPGVGAAWVYSYR